MQNDASAHREGRARRIRNFVSRIVHGKSGIKITLDVPCEQCEKARCRLNGIQFPQPDWGTPAWVHPPMDFAYPPFTVRDQPDHAPQWLSRLADSWAAMADSGAPKLMDGAADQGPAYSPSEEPPNQGQQPSPSGSATTGGSAPF
jgi:hypothetical protein